MKHTPQPHTVAARIPITGELATLSEQSERSQKARDPEQPDGRKTVGQWPGKMARDEHDAADIDKQQDALHVNRTGEGEIDPLAGGEFGSRRQEHGAEQNQEHGLQQFLKHGPHRDAGRLAFGGGELHAEAHENNERGGNQMIASLIFQPIPA